MREIKFRAYAREDASGMINADALWLDDYDQPIVNSFEDAQKHYYIMQYTGLKDKNGKEIYEGDILRWIKSSGAIRVEEVTDEVFYGIGLESLRKRDPKLDLEVIGNIYENPELLGPTY